MLHFTTISDVNKALSEEKQKGRSVGFVPTMGALHEGHLALVRRARNENDVVVVSIFVNPTQFNNPADLEKYPRMLQTDARLLGDGGCDMIFSPSVEEMYPEGDKLIDLDLGTLGEVMEGKFRPGHFRGVATIVKKLFDITGPRRAYLGKKDFQQVAVIRKLVTAYRLPVEIIACETVREPDGLAMSSRNLRLTPAERALAPEIYRVLRWTKEQAGHVPPRDLEFMALEKLNAVPAFRVEYFGIADPETLLPLEAWDPATGAVACTAVFLGEVRLIDNMELFS